MSQIELLVTNKNGEQLPINQKINKDLFDENGNLTVRISHKQILFCFERTGGFTTTATNEKNVVAFTLSPVKMDRVTMLPTIVMVTSRNTAVGYKIGLITWNDEHYLCLLPKWTATYSAATQGFNGITFPDLVAELMKPEHLTVIKGMQTIRLGSARKPKVGEVKVKYWDLEKGYGIGLTYHNDTVLLRAEYFMEEITLPFLPVDTIVECELNNNFAKNTAEYLGKSISIIEPARRTITTQPNAIGALIPTELRDKLYAGSEQK
ncbi:MAG: hypothetical protein KBB70_01460 [Candidatus Pacebacteria bacterium]|nr:hypothetical protein [Candidatus Paceibacterota bacterium]